ncbi:MAG: APC family permease [Hyphomicrobiaceae bacterium]|nr:APC family permease [Hyphomicrobiaceae bacterium]
MPDAAAPQPLGLKRALSLWQATLYGLGVTIGAGIYVMVGVASQRAGMQAPLAFLFAAGLMAATAASFAELAGRLPVAAGEAEYVRQAFGSRALATAVGVLVVAIAIISAAAITVGSVGYIAQFVSLPEPVLIALVVLAMGAVAAGGISQAVTAAGIMTLVEIGGLLLLIASGLVSSAGPGADLALRLPEALPWTWTAVVGVVSAVPLAVFAFIGFEGLANIAEEVREPRRTLPRAIFLTLLLSTLLYLSVIWVSLTSLPSTELAASKAPLSLVFERLTGASPLAMSAIAVVATLNGIIVQIIMASRVLYGLGRQGGLPEALARVSARTRTPLLATALTTAIVLVLALGLPLHRLADITAHITLVVFALVNLSLLRIKAREASAFEGFSVPAWVPWAGFLTCLAVTLSDGARLLLG